MGAEALSLGITSGSRPPFQGGSLRIRIPRAKALGYSLFALRAVETRAIKFPGCRGRALLATPLQGLVFRKTGVATNTPSHRLSLLRLIFLWTATAALISGCSKANSPAELGTQEVFVTEVICQDVPVVREWIGSLDGSVNADIRARVSGFGDLVGPSDSQPLMTISTVDPIKVYLNISEQDYLKYAKKPEQDRGADKAPAVTIILADGTQYPERGKFSAADREVDQQTGTIRFVALFPNPNNILRPGGFVRVQVTVRQIPGALLVPQRAVSELQTSYELAVVGADNKVQIRSIKVGERVGMLWAVEDGLKRDDRVIVEGSQKVHDGQIVKPVPWTRPADILPPK